jgi:hypothetical protein
VSSSFAAEPIPHHIEPILAEYLDRQFQAIMVALRSDFQAPRFTDLPDRKVKGAVIHVANPADGSCNGFYVCVTNGEGDGEWKRLVLEEPPTACP